MAFSQISNKEDTGQSPAPVGGKFFLEIFQQGKDFEKLVEKLIGANDAALMAKIETAFNLPGGALSEYEHVTQLQINLGGGKYFVADNAWVKKAVVNNQTIFECYIGESKLSSFTDLSDNQELFKTQFNNGTNNFTTRNSLNGPLSQNSTLNVKAAIRTNGPSNNILTSSF